MKIIKTIGFLLPIGVLSGCLIPSVRYTSIEAEYMKHSHKTYDEVIAQYEKCGIPNPLRPAYEGNGIYSKTEYVVNKAYENMVGNEWATGHLCMEGSGFYQLSRKQSLCTMPGYRNTVVCQEWKKTHDK